MKTSELIEKAKKTKFGKFADAETLNLFVEMFDRLEMAYDDLQNCECLTCGNREACDEVTAGSDWGCKWQWRGDKK